jgi:hypothetical protein
MKTLLLSVLPIVSILVVFVYASFSGLRMYRARGIVSMLGIAATIAGLTLGRLVDRFATLPRGLDDWVGYRDEGPGQVSTGGDRILAILSVEVALLFLFVSVLAVLAILLIKRDSTAQTGPVPRPGALPVLAAVFVFAAGMTTRSKIATFLAFLMAKGHLI